MAFTDEEIQEFKTEAVELLDHAEQSLLALDNGSPFKTQYDSIFRAFHSIKGAAGMMDMVGLQEHMHQLENILTEQKKHDSLDKPYIDFFLKGVDGSRRLLDGQTLTFNYDIRNASAGSSQPISSEPALVNVATKPVHAPAPVATPTLGKVLILDDEPQIVDLVSDILRGAGFTVHGFSAPEEILSTMEKFQPDVVLTDIAMPKMSGLQVLESIRQNNTEIPVLFISGHVNKDILLNAIQLGVFAVIEKPFDIGRVLEACRNAVHKYQLVRLLNNSINLLLYQFSDLDKFLKAEGKEDVRKVINREISGLLEQRRELRAMGKSTAHKS